MAKKLETATKNTGNADKQQEKKSALMESLKFISCKLLDARTILQKDSLLLQKPKPSQCLPL